MNDKEFIARQSRGVRANENDFQVSSEITVTEVENEMKYRKLYDAAARDADQSSISVQVEIPGSIRSSSENEVNFYRMKTTARKGLKERPSVVTFQQLNPRVARYHYKRRLPPHLSRSRWDIAPERNAQPVNVSHVPSLQQSNTIHNVDSYQSSEQYSQRLSFREKVRQVFMRLRRPENCERNSCVDIEKGNESAGFYHFDHGETSYYRTTDRLPHLTSDIVAQRVHDTFTRFWAEIFGFINVFVTLIITFLIQFYRFILYGILRALFIGVLQTTSDYLLKPLLALMFNGLLQPFFTLIQNILQSICDMAEPLAKLTDNMLRPFAELVRAFRIVEVKNQTKIHQPESQAPRFSTFQG